MSSRARLLLAVVLGISLLGLSTAGFAAVTVWRAGSILVSVDPKADTDPNFSMRIPAIVIPAVLAFIPDSAFRDAEPQIRAAIPLALKACELLEVQGDAVFVEVISRDERVRIAKVGDVLRVDVESNGDEVHVAVPVGSIRSVVARLDRALAASLNRA